MDTSQNIHWTEDSELLERYVLGHIEPHERSRLEGHLRECEMCRTAVRAEQGLVAGVRRLARDELKSRLRQRLLSEAPQQIPWLQLASAAAVIVIIVGVGVTSNWFTFREEKHAYMKDKEEAAPMSKETPSVGHPDKSGHPVGRKDSPPVRVPERDVGKSSSVRDEKTIDMRSKKKSMEEELKSLPSEQAAGAGVADEQEKRDAEKEFISNQFWVEGTLLSQEEIPALKKSERSIRSQREVAATEQAQDMIVTRGAFTQKVILDQRSSNALVISGRQNQRFVQTLVEQTESGLRFTIYRDPLFDESEMRNASIQPVTDDSLIIHIGGERIGYRIPGGWGK